MGNGYLRTMGGKQRAGDGEPIVEEVLLLRAVAAVRRGGQVEFLDSAMAQTLTLLALAGESGISSIHLQDGLTGRGGGSVAKDTLHQRIATLRNRHRVPIDKTRDGYALASSVTVDALRFVDGVNSLSATPTARELDALLGLWGGDPFPAHSSTTRQLSAWSPVRQAYETLIARVAAMPDQHRSALTHLADFVRFFPREPRLDALRPVREGGLPQLLVIDDQMAGELCELLKSRCHCTPVTSLEAFNGLAHALVADGALIDLHLSGRDDFQGLIVARALSERTEIPAALITVAPPPGLLATKIQQWRREFRILDVIYKGAERGVNEDSLASAVDVLVSRADRHERNRMRCWLEHYLYRIEQAYPAERTGSARQLAQAHTEARTVFRAIDTDELASARAQLDKFRGAWRAVLELR